MADSVTLYIKIRKFHRNVLGERFMELNKLLEYRYNASETANRINKFGDDITDTMKEFSDLSSSKNTLVNIIL